VDFSKDPDTGARRFSFQFGSGPKSTGEAPKTIRFSFSASPVADEDKLYDAALAQADTYVEAGSSLDTTCRLLNPRYKDWVSPQQHIYRGYLQNQIELRNLSAPQMTDTATPPVLAPTQDVPTAQPLGTERPSGHEMLSPLGQIIFFLVFFTLLTGAFLTAHYFYYRAK
jgi:hypothetical protein